MSSLYDEEMVAAIGLAGHARSGKSTLAAMLSRRVGARVVAFGDIVRQAARDQHLDPSDRATLMDVGQRWAETNPASLCSAVLRGTDAETRPLVIDGIRHVAIVEELRRQLNSGSLWLVFLAVPSWVLTERLEGEMDPRTHRSESEMSALELHADLVLDATASSAELCDAVVASIHTRPVRGRT